MWVEVLAHDGAVAARERIDTAEARIGRAFDNDVVVDDPHVAPHHLRVFRDDSGGLVAEDLGTLNGLYPEHGAERAARLSLEQRSGIRIGRTTLRIHDAARPVAPERALGAPRAHAAWAALLGVALLAMLGFLQWLDTTSQPRANVILLPLLGFIAILAVWAGVWAVLSRVFLGQARFALQLRIAVTACLVLIAWDQACETLSFALAWREMADYAALGVWALLAATCHAHLRAIGPRHMGFAMGIVGVLVGAGALLQYASRSEVRTLVGQSATLGELRPPELRLVPLASADEFFERAAATSLKVDRARTREPGGGLFADFEPDD